MRGIVEIRDDASQDDGPRCHGVHLVDGEQSEQADHGHDLEAAIDWARQRAPIVVVVTRWRSDGSLAPDELRFSAGIEKPAGETLPRLRPRPGEREMSWHVSWGDERGSVVRAASRAEATSVAVKERVRAELPPGSGSVGWTIGAPDVERSRARPRMPPC
jgi:hypothetical protein